ncbi:MAG: hypothetical protein HRU05_12510 [Oceanospirillaceae bacterium]|nr:hypothetical protein [Oceanospirillaceae bacterium]
MYRMYFLTDGIESAETIEQDLVSQGVDLSHIHVISHHEDEEQIHHLNSGNYLMRRNIVQSGERGLMIGLLVGLFIGELMMGVVYFREELGIWTLVITGISFSGFGAWVGGMQGLATENYKISKFHQQLEEGQYLMVVDIKRADKKSIIRFMNKHHAESTYGGHGSSITNPFKAWFQPKVIS